jgi:hypothetical protein
VGSQHTHLRPFHIDHSANPFCACFLIRININAHGGRLAWPEKSMEESTSRRRGRPSQSKTTPSDLSAYIWIRVQIYRIEQRILSGRTPSAAKTCAALIAGWGIRSVVGGSPEALARANEARKKRWRRFRLSESGPGLISDTGGTVFISHQIESAGALHARYSEANKLVKADPLVRLAWMNLGRQMLGRAVKKPQWANPSQPRAWRVKADGTFILATN